MWCIDTPGNYIARVFYSSRNAELSGGVTFTDEINLLTSRAIIVSGGGPASGAEIWEDTNAYANYAYENLVYKGYRYKDIQYLTDEPDALGRDGAATNADLQSAILSWAMGDPNTSDLLIYLVDHGETESFLMRGGATPELLTTDMLDDWLDELQSTLPGKVILINDSCRSGI